MPGTLFVVATPIGNLEDVSARALRVLREATVIAAEDTRRTAHLLARYAIVTSTTSLHEHNESQKTPALIDRLRRGDSIALVSDAGTPTISDPGERLIRAAIEAGIKVEPVPGPSAALAALAASGFATDSFTFLGFPPTRSKDRSKWFEEVKSAGRTVVFFESPHRIEATLQALLRSVGDCDVCVGRELTKAHEELVRGPISRVLAGLGSPRGEFTIVADVGRLTNVGQAEPPSDQEIMDEFGEMTNRVGWTRRKAVAALARKYAMSAKAVYDAIERAKISGE
jgi:16S rRNA (cytidine1402-2'-O)-methyltransferase